MLALFLLFQVVAAHDSDSYYSRTDIASMFVLMVLLLACVVGVVASVNAPPCEGPKVIRYVIENPRNPDHRTCSDC
jgi:hypothetical protein